MERPKHESFNICDLKNCGNSAAIVRHYILNVLRKEQRVESMEENRKKEKINKLTNRRQMTCYLFNKEICTTS